MKDDNGIMLFQWLRSVESMVGDAWERPDLDNVGRMLAAVTYIHEVDCSYALTTDVCGLKPICIL